MPECGVCTDDKPRCFACAHCAYVACGACATTWFQSQLSTPACMNCRKVLNKENLAGSFSDSAASALFADARRALLVRADAGHDLATMTVLMPVWRNLLESHDAVAEAAHDLRRRERELRARRLELHERCAAMMGAPPAKNAAAQLKPLRVAVEEAQREQVRFTRATYEPAVLHARSVFRRMCSAPLTGAGAGATAPTAATLAAVQRHLKCAAAGCAGLFPVATATCLVCSAEHCEECFELAAADHACAPGAGASATYVLANSKSCPRCHAAIQRAAGCDQMMCTNCHCIFNWSSGREVAGVVHNPHFFELGDEARARVAADRAARGLQAPPAAAPERAHRCDADLEFDPMCVAFDDPRILIALGAAYKNTLSTAGRPSEFSFLVSTYRNVLHLEHDDIPNLERSLATDFGEKSVRLLRLARLMGKPLQEIRRVTSAHPDGGASTSHAPYTHAAPLSDAKFAAQLMRIDTERSKVLERVEIKRTYVEAQKDQFRAALLVPPSERLEASKRIVDFRHAYNRTLDEVSSRARLAARARDAANAAKPPASRKRKASAAVAVAVVGTNGAQ